MFSQSHCGIKQLFPIVVGSIKTKSVKVLRVAHSQILIRGIVFYRHVDRGDIRFQRDVRSTSYCQRHCVAKDGHNDVTVTASCRSLQVLEVRDTLLRLD